MSVKEYENMRNMSDDELRAFLEKNYIKKGNKHCSKCTRKAKYYVKIENVGRFQTKRLCCLCQQHYEVLLRHLKTEDINWEE